MEIKDRNIWISLAAYLLAAMVFLSIGDAFSKYWYAFIRNSEHIFIVAVLFMLRDYTKKLSLKRFLEVGIVFKMFYIVFTMAVLFEPLKPFRDFTTSPVICVQMLWCLIGFSIFQMFRK